MCEAARGAARRVERRAEPHDPLVHAVQLRELGQRQLAPRKRLHARDRLCRQHRMCDDRSGGGSRVARADLYVCVC